jgi:hypothetical protein
LTLPLAESQWMLRLTVVCGEVLSCPGAAWRLKGLPGPTGYGTFRCIPRRARVPATVPRRGADGTGPKPRVLFLQGGTSRDTGTHEAGGEVEMSSAMHLCSHGGEGPAPWQYSHRLYGPRAARLASPWVHRGGFSRDIS